jgi:hypothetical protein
MTGGPGRSSGCSWTLARAGNVRDACRAVRMSTTSAYRLRRIDSAFAEAWDAALKRAAISLEAVAYARAVEGVEEVVIRDGKEAWRKRRYSDSLLRLLLQASDPDKYGRMGGGSVQAGAALERRIAKIEQAAYRRAWRALITEYRYHCEPVAMRIWLHRKLAAMHQRICGYALCPECHPERIAEHRARDPYTAPPPCEPIDGPAIWIDQEHFAAEVEVLKARMAGATDVELHVPPSPEPGASQGFPFDLPPPPPWMRYGGEDAEADALEGGAAVVPQTER